MPIVPLYGHEAVRQRLTDALARQALPASLLLHGPAGIGKQRLALWLAQTLLCQAPAPAARPCGACQDCRYAGQLAHPDLHWFFPQPRPDSPRDQDEVQSDFAEAIAERVKANGLYARPGGMEGIFVDTVHAMVRQAASTPAMGVRKVFVVGDVERMVPQASSQEAANAFLKLLEEPPADTTVIITSSEPGSLLPTIRSRVVALRMTPLGDAEMRAWIEDPMVREALAERDLPKDQQALLAAAGGAPGMLLSSASLGLAREDARTLLDAATQKGASRYRAAFLQGSTKARGKYSDTLDALTALLHEEIRRSLTRNDARRARAASQAVDHVEAAKERAQGNVSPQLISARLTREIGALLS